MNLSDMRVIVRRDLHDEDAAGYRWTNDEIDRHIAHAVTDLSEAIPYEQKAVKATTSGSREIDISSITNRVNVELVEYPASSFPANYQRFSLWADIVTLLGDEVPDGSNANIYYGKLHTLDATSSTIPVIHEDLIATGAAGYAAVEWAIYAVNKVNVGGKQTPDEFLNWGEDKLGQFKSELKRLGRRNQVRIRSLFRPCNPVKSQSTDYGP